MASNITYANKIVLEHPLVVTKEKENISSEFTVAEIITALYIVAHLIFNPKRLLKFAQSPKTSLNQALLNSKFSPPTILLCLFPAGALEERIHSYLKPESFCKLQ